VATRRASEPEQDWRDRKQAEAADRYVVLRDYIELVVLTECVACGEDDPDLLEFDHEYGAPGTSRTLKATAGGGSLAAVQREAAKGECRCANCHAKRHADERRYAATG
jgi:hypothetical protein